MQPTKIVGPLLRCSNCRKDLPHDSFHRAHKTKRRYSRLCKPCARAYGRIWRGDNGASLKVSKIEYYRRVRLAGIAAYGSRCKCCGETQQEFLTVDHIKGRDKSERRRTGKRMWAYLHARGWPKDNFQLLCWNCNCAKGVYGACPHTGIYV